MHKSSQSLSVRLNSPSSAVAKPWLSYATSGAHSRLISAVASESIAVAVAPVGDMTADKLARVEAILLLAREPLPSRKLAALAD